MFQYIYAHDAIVQYRKKQSMRNERKKNVHVKNKEKETHIHGNGNNGTSTTSSPLNKSKSTLKHIYSLCVNAHTIQGQFTLRIEAICFAALVFPPSLSPRLHSRCKQTHI